MSRSSVAARTRCAVVAAVVALTGANAVAQPLTVTAGVNVRALSGAFGSGQTTTVIYVPTSVRVDVGRVEASVALPFVSITDGTVALSQGGFVPMQGSLTGAPGVGMSMTRGAGMMSGGTAAPGSSRLGSSLPAHQSGMGDLVGAVGYRVVDSVLSGVQVVVGTRVKLPTASRMSGLGTGKVDVGALAAVRRRFARGWTYVEGGYLFVGEPPGVDLRNAVLWSVGGGRRLSGRTSLLASASGNTAILREFGAPLEVGVGLGVRAGDRLALTILPTVGLTEASPRVALTVGVSRRLFER